MSNTMRRSYFIITPAWRFTIIHYQMINAEKLRSSMPIIRRMLK